MQMGIFRVFCDLAETSSFTRAVELYGVSPSALSQMFTALEREFNARLADSKIVD